ncbi:hypothetical protein VTL71DRAFT_9750 [Oculimacula yallundae]|uniref:Uncharacterized protein n=1 Tax=Oculimacula yallundae TaxID=86028 RepID=A0ABR4BRS5_9HELO
MASARMITQDNGDKQHIDTTRMHKTHLCSIKVMPPDSYRTASPFYITDLRTAAEAQQLTTMQWLGMCVAAACTPAGTLISIQQQGPLYYEEAPITAYADTTEDTSHDKSTAKSPNLAALSIDLDTGFGGRGSRATAIWIGRGRA